MNIENDIFKRSVVDFNKLIKYGFKKENNLYVYSVNFFNDDFRADIIINESGFVEGKVWDLQADDEYIGIRIENSVGKFVSNVREEYKKILKDIKDKCFSTEFFIKSQSNRIANYILEKYNISPEFLWSKFPGYGVFRNKDNGKWFGIIMNLDESKLNDNVGELEIIDLKINKSKIKELLEKDGYYKAYHMNKDSWITIILNETIKDEEIFDLIDESYNKLIK